MRQKIDHLLVEAGWKGQDRKELDLNAGVGAAISTSLSERQAVQKENAYRKDV